MSERQRDRKPDLDVLGTSDHSLSPHDAGCSERLTIVMPSYSRKYRLIAFSGGETRMKRQGDNSDYDGRTFEGDRPAIGRWLGLR